MLKKIWLHLDNSRVHNSKVTLSITEKYGFKRAPHPAYSPDIAPSDSFLFGYIKGKLKGCLLKSLDDLKKRYMKFYQKFLVNLENQFLKLDSSLQNYNCTKW